MRRIWLAIRLFFLVLFKGEVARRLDEVLSLPSPAAGQTVPKLEKPQPAAAPVRDTKPVRSEAITLLAAMQREARFVDFVQEDLSGYTDAQIGAAVRDMHRQCGKLLERLFALRPLCSQSEGEMIEVPAGFDPARFHLSGRVDGSPPFRGRVVHPGWEATRCELPVWTGGASAARVVAPIEVEIP